MVQARLDGASAQTRLQLWLWRQASHRQIVVHAWELEWNGNSRRRTDDKETSETSDESDHTANLYPLCSMYRR